MCAANVSTDRLTRGNETTMQVQVQLFVRDGNSGRKEGQRRDEKGRKTISRRSTEEMEDGGWKERVGSEG